MPADCLIGIDVGTTAIKATVFAVDGRVLQALSYPYPTQRPDDTRVEQDPAHWIDAIDRALATLATQVPAERVQAIGLTSQVNTHVFLDRSGAVLAPAIVWQDTRAADAALGIDATLSDDERLGWWGAPLPVDASHALARMRWMQQHQDDIWRRTCHVVLPKDYCLMHLTGELLSDPIANIGLVDLQLRYADELLHRIEGAAALLPPLASPTDVAGRVRGELPYAGTPVGVGTMDAWAGMLGCGVCRPGQGVYLSGTSEVLGIVSDELKPTPGVLVMPRCEDITLHVGPTQAGGASQAWFCELFDISPETMAALAAGHDPQQRHPLFLPHLQGERAPLWDADSRGVFVGLDNTTSRATLARAVYEGVACSAAWLFDGLCASSATTPSVLNGGGGGFQSDVWNQIRADMLGVRLRRVAVRDPGTLGAASLAAVAAGHHDTLAEALDTLVRIDREYSPDPGRRAQAKERLALYRDTYRQTRPLSQRWLQGRGVAE